MLFLLVSITSCQEQTKTESPGNSTGMYTSSLGPTSITRNIILDKAGNVLLSAYEGIIRYDGNTFTNMTKETGLDTCYAFDVLEDTKGNIWIGSNLDGAYCYDGNTYTHFTTKEGLAHNRLIDIYEDSAGNIWFVTMGGLSRYDRNTGFTNFTTNEGLPHNDVSCIIEDRTGKFWIGSRGEACVYDPASLKPGGKAFTKLTNEEGAPFYNIVSIIEDRKGNIWLGGKDGLWRYSPDQNGGSFTKLTNNSISCVYEDRKGNIWTNTDGWTNKKQANSHTWGLSRYDEKSLTKEHIIPVEIRSGKGMYFGILEDLEGNIWVGKLDGVFRYDARLPDGVGHGMSFNDFNE